MPDGDFGAGPRMRTATPHLSVIIPVHNGEKYLAESIQSVLDQDCDDLEILVIDNASTDATATVARAYPCVDYHFLAEKGLVNALNDGIGRSRGEYLAFVDADDLWQPNKLAAQQRAFENSPDLDMVFGHVEQFVSPELPESQKARLHIREKILPGRVKGTLVIRKSSFMRVGPFENTGSTGEFIDWYMRAREQGLREVMLPEVLLRRRIHGLNVGFTEGNGGSDFVRILKRGLDRRRRRGAA